MIYLLLRLIIIYGLYFYSLIHCWIFINISHKWFIALRLLRKYSLTSSKPMKYEILPMCLENIVNPYSYSIHTTKNILITLAFNILWYWHSKFSFRVTPKLFCANDLVCNRFIVFFMQMEPSKSNPMSYNYSFTIKRIVRSIFEGVYTYFSFTWLMKQSTINGNWFMVHGSRPKERPRP